jgi:hypothetical protein
MANDVVHAQINGLNYKAVVLISKATKVGTILYISKQQIADNFRYTHYTTCHIMSHNISVPNVEDILSEAPFDYSQENKSW